MELDVVFKNEKGQKLIGTLAFPEGNEKCPGIILCHGFTANKELHFFPELAKALVAEGIAVLRFDCHACGKSEGRLHPTYKTMIDDFSSALHFMKKQERIDTIGVAGHSMGGTSAIMLAASHEEIRAVVTFAAVAHPLVSANTKRDVFKDMPDGTYTKQVNDRTFLFNNDWFSDAAHIKPLESIHSISAPILLIHGTDDTKIALDEAKQLFLVANMPKSIKMIEGANHTFKGYYEPLIKSATSFFKKYL